MLTFIREFEQTADDFGNHLESVPLDMLLVSVKIAARFVQRLHGLDIFNDEAGSPHLQDTGHILAN